MNKKVNYCLFTFLLIVSFGMFFLGADIIVENYKIWRVKDSFYPEIFEVESFIYLGRKRRLAVGEIRGKEFKESLSFSREITIGSKVPVWYSKNHPELLFRNPDEVVFDFSRRHKSVRLGFILIFPLLIIFIYLINLFSAKNGERK